MRLQLNFGKTAGSQATAFKILFSKLLIFGSAVLIADFFKNRRSNKETKIVEIKG